MKNIVGTQPINLQGLNLPVNDLDEYRLIRSINIISDYYTLYFNKYTDTHYIVLSTELKKLSDEIHQTLLELGKDYHTMPCVATNRAKERKIFTDAVIKVVKKYAKFTVDGRLKLTDSFYDMTIEA